MYTHIVQPRIAFWLVLPCLLAFAAMAQLVFEISGNKPDGLWTWSSTGEKRQLALARSMAMTEGEQQESASNFAIALLETRPWSPLRWCDLAELHEADGEPDVAARFFVQAAELGGPMPLVWIRKANFHWRQGQTEEALAAFRTALAVPSPYQPAIYVALDGLQLPQERIFHEVVSVNRLAASDYLRYRIRTKTDAGIPALWRMFIESHGTDDALAAAVSMKLWAAGQRDESVTVWRKATGESGSSAGFDGPWLTSPFAWRCDGCGEVKLSRSAETPDELTLVFPGHLNRRFDGLKKIVELAPGSYELRFRWKGNGDGYQEGAQFVVRHAMNRNAVLAQSGDLLETRGWRDERLTFHLDQRTFIELGIVRSPFRRVPGNEESRLSVSALSLTQQSATERTVAAR